MAAMLMANFPALTGSVIDMQPVPKPSKEAQTSESEAKKVLLSDVYATAKTKLFGRPWNKQDYSYTIFMLVVHGLCLLAPATFSWPMVGLFFASYFITGASQPPLHLYATAAADPKWHPLSCCCPKTHISCSQDCSHFESFCRIQHAMCADHVSDIW